MTSVLFTGSTSSSEAEAAGGCLKRSPAPGSVRSHTGSCACQTVSAALSRRERGTCPPPPGSASQSWALAEAPRLSREMEKDERSIRTAHSSEWALAFQPSLSPSSPPRHRPSHAASLCLDTAKAKAQPRNWICILDEATTSKGPTHQRW